MDIGRFLAINIYEIKWINFIFLAALAAIIIQFFISIWRNQVWLYTPVSQYSAEQRAHSGEVSRSGGIAIYFSLLAFYYLMEETTTYNFKYLLLLISPLMLVSFIEDIFNNVSIIIRLFFMIFCSMISCYAFGNFGSP